MTDPFDSLDPELLSNLGLEEMPSDLRARLAQRIRLETEPRPESNRTPVWPLAIMGAIGFFVLGSMSPEPPHLLLAVTAAIGYGLSIRRIHAAR